MKTFNLNRTVNPQRLSREIVNALIVAGWSESDARNRDGGICIRSDTTPDNPIGTFATVLVSDAAPDAVIQTAIDAHDGTLDPHPKRTDLRQNAEAAVAAIDAYLAIADTATPAQVRDQVERLSQMVRRLIIRVVQID